MEKTKYNENQSVFKVGELPDKMYLLVKGSVGIFLPTNETKKPNFIIQENELFGEMGVIENELRMATARCLVESEIISITKDEFHKTDPVKASKAKISPVLLGNITVSLVTAGEEEPFDIADT